jgi:iron complex transport system substrate-binding protein
VLIDRPCATQQQLTGVADHMGTAPSAPHVLWSRRRFLTGTAAVVLAGATSACGSGSAGSAGPSGAATTGGFPRTVDHAVGSTRIEAPPARVVAVTDGAELASLLALGITPVGFGRRNDPLTPWISEAGGDDPAIERYDLAGEPNFELMATWRPDVIVGQYGFVLEENIADFTAVAPTVATSFVGWRDNLRQAAAATGTDDRAKDLIAELEAEIAEAADRLAGISVTTRWVFGFPDYLGQLNDRSPIGALLTEMGMPTLAPQEAEGEAADQIVPERLGDALADADAVVVLDFEDPEGDGDAALSEQALYRSAPAVAAGRIVRLGVDESNAAYFDSVLTVRRNLDLIERVLGELG